MDNEQRLVFLAERATVDTERSDIFLLIDFLLFDSAENLNHQGVTAEFIESVVNNPEKYDALPLYADTEKLLAGDFDNLGHNYDQKSGTFDTEQIGGFNQFRADVKEGVTTLYGTARIPKRQTQLCQRLAEMYAAGKLHVSFEVRFDPEKTVEMDGVRFVDAGDKNYLSGMCVVSVPAFKNADALNMVAERQDPVQEVAQANASDNEVNKMDVENVNAEAEVVEAVEEVVAEQTEETVAEVAESQEDAAEQNEETVSDEQHEEAELVHECVEIREEVNVDPDGECPPVHVIEERHVLVETIEETVNEEAAAEEPAVDYEKIIADKDAIIAGLMAQIDELKPYKEQIEAMKAEQEKAERLRKMECAREFAKCQGLDDEDADVKAAIDALDYEKLAEMSMAKKRECASVAVASYAMSGSVGVILEYGGLLARKGQ